MLSELCVGRFNLRELTNMALAFAAVFWRKFGGAGVANSCLVDNAWVMAVTNNLVTVEKEQQTNQKNRYCH